MKNILVYSIVLMCTIIVSCGHSAEEKQRLSNIERARIKTEDSLSLKIAVMPTLDCLPLYLAEELNLFDTLGVDVHLYKYNAGMDCDTAIAEGRVEGIVTDLIRAERLQKKGIKLGYITSTNAYWQLISNRLARVKEIKQLSDKMIAMTRYSATDYLFNLAIDSVKPKGDVYKVQINDVNLRLKMLQNNEMDAALLPEPQATEARLYSNPVLMDSRDKNIQFGVIAFKVNSLQDKRVKNQVDKFIKAYNMACDSLNIKGFGAYIKIVKKHYNISDRTIKNLPKLEFEHAATPRIKDIKLAKDFKFI